MYIIIVMKYKELLKLIKENGGIIRANELASFGISRYKLTELVNTNVLEHVTKGVYALRDHLELKL